jgi:hypothetical protein
MLLGCVESRMVVQMSLPDEGCLSASAATRSVHCEPSFCRLTFRMILVTFGMKPGLVMVGDCPEPRLRKRNWMRISSLLRGVATL